MRRGIDKKDSQSVFHGKVSKARGHTLKVIWMWFKINPRGNFFT